MVDVLKVLIGSTGLCILYVYIYTKNLMIDRNRRRSLVGVFDRHPPDDVV
jgi:hypothetical protein